MNFCRQIKVYKFNANFKLRICANYVLVAQLKYTKNLYKTGYFVNLNMQGKKSFTPQLFVSVNLLDLGSRG